MEIKPLRQKLLGPTDQHLGNRKDASWACLCKHRDRAHLAYLSKWQKIELDKGVSNMV